MTSEETGLNPPRSEEKRRSPTECLRAKTKAVKKGKGRSWQGRGLKKKIKKTLRIIEKEVSSEKGMGNGLRENAKSGGTRTEPLLYKLWQEIRLGENGVGGRKYKLIRNWVLGGKQ